LFIENKITVLNRARPSVGFYLVGEGGGQNLKRPQWTRPLKVDFYVAKNEMKKPIEGDVVIE